MKSIFLFLAITFLFFSFSSISTAQKSTSKGLLKQKIDDYIKAEMKVQKIPGLAYAVVLNDKIIDSGVYGLANVELNVPVNSHSLFNIGSIGKTFTATAIMLLQKDGKLSINDPINKYLDSLPDTWSTITIKHLLSHTSGIKDHWHDFPGYPFLKIDRKQEITEAQFIKIATSAPLNFTPGERWAYSNANFTLLGFIIHKVSGKPLPEFMKERITAPIGMRQTRYENFTEIIPNRATGYLLDDSNTLIHGLYFSNFYASQGEMGIITTATDMGKWSMAFDEGKLLDKETLQHMWTPSVLNNGLEAVGLVGANYGLGWGILDHRGHKEISHGGSFGNGYTAQFVRFPEQNLAVIVLTNLNPTSVNWVSYNIAGFYIPELKGIDQLKAEVNPDTALSKKVYALLDGLGNDNLDTSLVTLGFKQRINPITKLLFNGQGARPLLTFVHLDRIENNTLLRYGVPVEKISYYKITVENETHYLAIYFTVNNKIADMRGY
jgi:D-alanyl-D-alanine carboxypeptidase